MNKNSDKMNIKHNIRINKDNAFDIDFVTIQNKNYVRYYDKDNDIIIYNDIVKVYDNDIKGIVNVYDNDNVLKGILDNIDNIKDNKCIVSHYQFKDLLNKVNDIDLIGIDNNNKYLRIKDFGIDIDLLKDNINAVVNDNNKYVFLDNTDNIDIDNDLFIKIAMNKDIYNDNYYDFSEYIDFAFVNYNYDNDNVYIFVKDNVIDFVLSHFDYNYCPLKTKKTLDFLNNEKAKYLSEFNTAKDKYLTLKDKDNVNNKRIKALLKYGNSKKQSIDKVNAKINNVYTNIMPFNMTKQYIIKNSNHF